MIMADKYVLAEQRRLTDLQICGCEGRKREIPEDNILIREWHPDYAPSLKEFLRCDKSEKIKPLK